jgi:hypothetical protein
VISHVPLGRTALERAGCFNREDKKSFRSWARCMRSSATDCRASTSLVPEGNWKTSVLSNGFVNMTGSAWTGSGAGAAVEPVDAVEAAA